jgi:hypothetical protein
VAGARRRRQRPHQRQRRPVRARRERGRDQETGKPVEDSSGLGRDERRAACSSSRSRRRSAREIAHALGIPYSTVLRDLGRKT